MARRLSATGALALCCAAALCCLPSARAGTVDLGKECPNNLIKNPGFEDFDITDVSSHPKAPWNTYNSKWGWYTSFPAWTAGCLKTDWMPYGGRPMVVEVQRGAVATPAEGRQNIELLPNATGVVCQTVDVAPGAKYRLSFYYGRLQTYAWRNEQAGQFTKFETKLDAIARDGATPAPFEADPARAGVYPRDPQGFTRLVTADTEPQASQWQRYEAEVTGPPSGKLQLAFTTTKRPKECGSCGSLLDAVCLQRA